MGDVKIFVDIKDTNTTTQVQTNNNPANNITICKDNKDIYTHTQVYDKTFSISILIKHSIPS